MEFTLNFFQHIRDGINASDTGVWRDFFLSAQGLICYQRAEDATPRVCVPGSARDAVLQAFTVMRLSRPRQ
jgi:hypothetical protein